MSQDYNKVAQRLKNALKNDLREISYEVGDLTLVVEKSALVKVLTFLRDATDLHFKLLVDITGVDFPDESPRFEVVYHLLSLEFNTRVRVKIQVDEDAPVPTVTGLFSCANWLEREVWDMYGISFLGHPDMRRILTDYGFEGHPLRKDFPLTGYNEVRYDISQKRVVYEPVKLQQDFRNFDFLSPWEGMTRPRPVLPGDEKANTEEGAEAENVSA